MDEPVADLPHLKVDEVERALDGLPGRRHAADVAADAVRAAARDWLGRRR